MRNERGTHVGASRKIPPEAARACLIKAGLVLSGGVALLLGGGAGRDRTVGFFFLKMGFFNMDFLIAFFTTSFLAMPVDLPEAFLEKRLEYRTRL
jgi:hypothetical protein